MKHIVVGVVSLGLGIWGLAAWFTTFGLVMRGVVPFMLLIFGLVAVYSGLRHSSISRRPAVVDEEELDDDDELYDEDEESDEEEFAA